MPSHTNTLNQRVSFFYDNFMSTIFLSIPLYPFSPPTPASSPSTPVQFVSGLNMSLAYAIPRIQSSALGEKKAYRFCLSILSYANMMP